MQTIVGVAIAVTDATVVSSVDVTADRRADATVNIRRADVTNAAILGVHAAAILEARFKACWVVAVVGLNLA